MHRDRPSKPRFKRDPVDLYDIDIARTRTAKGTLFLVVAMDRTRRFAVARLREKAGGKTARPVLELL